MKKLFITCFAAWLSSAATAQFYYNDIVATRETSRQMAAYNTNKVKTATATGYDKNNVQASDFSEFYQVMDQGRTLKIVTINQFNKTANYSRFDPQGRLVSITDSISAIKNFTTYTYDEAGHVVQVRNTVQDSSNNFNQVETHTWIYTAEGRPEKMWRVVENTGSETGTDSLEVRFVYDSGNNPVEERTYRKGVQSSYLYYYYDEQDRLSDIVRFNSKLNKLVPDIMFEYDNQDRVIQKITVTSDRVVGYLIWRYIFDERGLKTKEALFNNDKQLTGKIEYAYTTGG